MAGPAINLQRTENLVQLLPVEIVRIRKVGIGNHRNAFRHQNQPVGVGVRQRLDQRSVHKGKDGHTGADPEGQH